MRFIFVTSNNPGFKFFSLENKKLKGALILTASAALLALLSGCSSKSHRRAEKYEKDIPDKHTSYLAKKVKVPSEAVQSPVVSKNSQASSKNIDPKNLKINPTKTAAGLGIPINRLEDQARILANFLETGRVPKRICEEDEQGVHEHLCEMIEDFRNTRRKISYSSYSQRRVPIRPHHFRIQQGMGYGRLLNSISREPAGRVLAWSPKLLAQTSCPRNLSAAALRKLETLLPHPRAKYMMEKLYEHASACLTPEDEGFEVTHFRQALLRHMWGNSTGARFSINRAVLAEESAEKSRVLYWAGLLQATPQKRRHFWDELVKDYPLSYHALEVWKEEKQDPLFLFSSRPDIQLNSKTQNPDETVTQSLHWVEALYLVERIGAAEKLTRWISTSFKDQLTPSNKFYLSVLKTSNSSTNNSIHFLTRQVANNPDILNEQTLKMLFPRPYYDIFSRASPNTDTNLVLAVARQESGFNPRARSPANAQGLLQLLPSTARMLTRERRPNLYDEETNAELGVKFLSQLIERFGSVEEALMGYNAGPGRVSEWRERFPTRNSVLFMDLVPFKETRNYVSSILRNNYWYTRLYSKQNQANRTPAQSLQQSRLVSQLLRTHLASSKSYPTPMATGEISGRNDAWEVSF